MFRVVALQTERCVCAAADIALFRVADVLFAGTVTRFALHTFERCVLVSYLEILLDTQTLWYGRRHTPRRSIAPFSGVFGRRRRGALLTIGDIPARGIAGTLPLRRTRFPVVALKVAWQRAARPALGFQSQHLYKSL